MKYIYTIMLVLFICSCQNNFCDNELENIYVRNGNYTFNCGLEHITIENKEHLKFICEELTKMNKVYVLGTNYNSGYLEIIKNKSNDSFLKNSITLIFTVENGCIFRLNDGFNYKNDELSLFLINKLKIENIYSEELCEYYYKM
jgi:hypothetical protein